MAHKQHNPADDFDLMLRRHLKQGGAPVAPCTGFDADTASAYVERALSAAVQLQFVKHLSGCAACRRHVVALARLSDQLSPLPVAAPAAPVRVAEPLWTRWQNAVAHWFDFSAWNLGWTAATGAACAVLFAALGAGVWLRAQAPHSESANKVAAVLGTDTPAAAAQTPESLAVGTSDALNDATRAEAANAKLNQPEIAASGTPQAGLLAGESASSARLSIPQPATTPGFPVTNTNSLVAITSVPELRTLAVEPSAPTVAPPSVPPPAFNLPTTGISFGHLNGNQPVGGMSPVRLVGDSPMRSSSQLVLLPGEPEKKELMNELLLPGPRRNRAAEEAAKSSNEAGTANTEAGKATSNRELLKALKGRTFGFMPQKGADKDAKDIDARTKEADRKEAQDQVKPLMKRLNGHVFLFDHGFWIDDEYNSETKLPIKRLTRGSQEYQQILIQNPSLEQFFQLGQVIVVWKGVVYEVHK